MCGIFGYVGPQNPAQACLKGLKKLEYRGYDSAGLAGILEGKIFACKEAGKIHALEAALERTLEAVFHKREGKLELAIAHTRWATHGKPSQENSHPHFDETQSIALVHNGIIENYLPIKERLKAKGNRFYSDTDTEVIAQLISDCYKGDILQAVQQALHQLTGMWGIALIHKDYPNAILAAARENPIAIGINRNTKEAFVSSDANAFDDPDLEIFFLDSGEIALITADDIHVINADAIPMKKQGQKMAIDASAISKNGYPHFMLKEIFEQPHTLHQAMQGRLDFNQGIPHFNELSFSEKEIQGIERILILACGTSWHAGQIAASWLEERARIPAQAEIASEFRHKESLISDKTLVIAISQSGETLDTIAAVRAAKAKGARILGICNVRNSALTREAECTLFLNAGREVSVCSTKAFTSQLTVLFLFSVLMAHFRGMPLEKTREWMADIEKMPVVATQVLHLASAIEILAKKYAKYQQMFFLGRHLMYTTSLEAALKLKEISYINAQAYPAGEMKHGPIALVDPALAVIGLCGSTFTFDKMISNLTEVRARGAPVLALAPEGCREIEAVATDVLYLPSTPELLAPLAYSIAAQLFAYYVAIERGTDIDQPRNLAKSVTVE